MNNSVLVTTLEWMGAALALVGVYVLTHNKKEGFLFCVGNNVLFLIMSFFTKQWGMLSLMLGYLYLNGLGYHKWRRGRNS